MENKKEYKNENKNLPKGMSGEAFSKFFESLSGSLKVLSLPNIRVPRALVFILAGLGFFLLLIGLTFRSGGLAFLGFLMLAAGLYLGLAPGGVLRKEQVVDSWEILIEKGKGKADEVFKDAEKFLRETEVPGIEIRKEEIAPGLIRGVFGVRRDFLVVKDAKNSRLSPYQIFIGARDYGNNLDVSWYLTYRPLLTDALICLLTLGLVKRSLRDLDLFDLQDLTAFATNCHHSLLKAVEKLMLSLNQDPSKIERKSRGFLGVS